MTRSRAEAEALRGEWGERFEANLEMGRRAARQFGLEGGEVAAMERALGTRKMLTVLQRIGRGLGEDSFEGGERPNSFRMSPQSARARIEALRPTAPGAPASWPTAPMRRPNGAACNAWPIRRAHASFATPQGRPPEPQIQRAAMPVDIATLMDIRRRMGFPVGPDNDPQNQTLGVRLLFGGPGEGEEADPPMSDGAGDDTLVGGPRDDQVVAPAAANPAGASQRDRHAGEPLAAEPVPPMPRPSRAPTSADLRAFTPVWFPKTVGDPKVDRVDGPSPFPTYAEPGLGELENRNLLHPDDASRLPPPFGTAKPVRSIVEQFRPITDNVTDISSKNYKLSKAQVGVAAAITSGFHPSISSEALATFMMKEHSLMPGNILQIKRGWTGGDINNIQNQINWIEHRFIGYKAIARKALGYEPNDGQAYVIHQQGPAGGAGLLSSPPDVPAVSAVRDAIMRADPRATKESATSTAIQHIKKNIPDNYTKDVNSLTSGEFLNYIYKSWKENNIIAKDALEQARTIKH